MGGRVATDSLAVGHPGGGERDIAVRKTHFRLAGCFLIADHGLRRRLAEDSQPYQRRACERPARGRAACPQAAAERLHARFPEISFGKRYKRLVRSGAVLVPQEQGYFASPARHSKAACLLDMTINSSHVEPPPFRGVKYW